LSAWQRLNAARIADNAPVHATRSLAVAIAAVLCAVPGCSTSRQPPDVPDRLADLTKSTDAELVAAAEKAAAESKAELGGHSTVAAYYGEKANAVLLIATHDKINLGKQWQELQKDAGKPLPRQQLHDVECVDEGDGSAYLCMWSDDVSGIVIDVRAGSTIERAAAAAREAKDALN
jgi:hypothetical protein